MAGRVCVDPQLLLRIMRPTAKRASAEAKRAAVFGVEDVHRRNGQVKMRHLRMRAIRPSRLRQNLDLLKSELAST